MKQFLKHILAVFIGLMIFSVVASIIAVVGIAGMVASATSSSTSTVKDGSVLVLKLDELTGELNASTTPQDYLMGDTGASYGLTETLAAVKKAKNSDKIKGIYIEAGGSGLNLAQSQELRNGLQDFKKSGKWIVAYGDAYHAGDYYISSVADKIYLNPQGTLRWRGLGGAIPMMKNFYEKLGIKQIAFKCGKYKSATEVYTEDHLSQPARQQEERIMNVAWKNICDAVSKSRSISVDSLNSYADRMTDLDDQKSLVSRKLVDGLLYYDQISDEIRKRLNVDGDDDIPQVTVGDLQDLNDSGDGGKVAVYYASGEILDYPPQQFLGFTDMIVCKDMVDDLNDLADDDDVKAVVLRINSPGGSSYASEQIWRAIEMLKKKKPVVVSMSDVAASGGYYISCGANYIFADPMTETGSIGVFGIYPDGSNLLNDKLGLNYEMFNTNRNGTEGASTSIFGLLEVGINPLTPEQIQREQTNVDNVYTLFKSRVAQGRHLSMARVEEIAQGHVYIGSDALKLKLVDELGGLDKAEAKAAKLAKLDNYHAAVYPEPKSFIESMLDKSNANDNHLNEQLKAMLGASYQPLMMVRKIGCMGRIQALMPYQTQIQF